MCEAEGEEGCAEGDLDETPVPSMPFSWAGTVFDVCVLFSRISAAVAAFWEDTGSGFASVHNLWVDSHADRKNGEKFARDVLSGLNDL